MIDLAMIEQCSFGVHPATVVAIIQAESDVNPLALNINSLARQPKSAQSIHAAAQLAQTYIDAGYSVDMGLMQVNSQHLKRFIATPIQILEPCQNILIGTTILHENYLWAQRSGLEGDAAMRAALSAYNTGNFTNGVTNGYVENVLTGKDTRSQDAAAARSPARVEFHTGQEADMPKNANPAVDAAIQQVRDIQNTTSMVKTEVSPEVAEQMGAFEEDAITEADAIESLFDDEVGTDG